MPESKFTGDEFYAILIAAIIFLTWYALLFGAEKVILSIVSAVAGFFVAFLLWQAPQKFVK